MTSKIEWTDETWPVVTGCTPVSPGCKHCYAARMAATRLKHHPRYRGLAAMAMPGVFGWTGKVRLNRDVLEQPPRWKKPRRIFVASMGDLFHEDVSPWFVCEIWQVMRECPQHTFQILTKRPRRMRRLIKTYIADHGFGVEPLPNVHLGVSVENQKTTWRTQCLRETPAAIRFLSLEPLLGPIDLRGGLHVVDIHWVIVGGESGPNARPMDPNWARDIRDQCQAAGTPFFMKQMSKRKPIPEDLMIREYPR